MSRNAKVNKTAKTPSKRTRELLIVSTQRELAHFFSASRTSIQSWISNGMPGEPGRYDLRECIQWKEKRDAERERRQGRSPEQAAHQRRLLEAKVRIQEADAAAKEQRVRELRESMLPANECALCLTLLREAARARFMKLPEAVKLDGLDKKVAAMIREELRHQVELVLIEMGDFHLPEPIRR